MRDWWLGVTFTGALSDTPLRPNPTATASNQLRGFSQGYPKVTSTNSCRLWRSVHVTARVCKCARPMAGECRDARCRRSEWLRCQSMKYVHVYKHLPNLIHPSNQNG